MNEAEPAAQDSLLGTRIDGRYTVHRELGRGGMGIVYEGVHDDLGRAVAIKVLNLAWASDPTAVARFLREARTASSFSHGNIVDVTDLGRLPDGRPYLIMPKIVGTDLAALLAENGAQPAKRVAHLLAGVAAALDLIHAKGFVHRDIKPENLMYVVREDGSETVMLLDFGIAAAVMSNEPRLTGQGAIFGTPQFMPPEVCNGGMPDARGDVYALATVAFELITGSLPFGDDNMMRVLTAKLTQDPPTLSEVTGITFPAELEAVVARGLARDPRQRFTHATEFIAALKAATSQAPVSWRSGVLRPSFRSAAHPVGIHPNAVTQRTPTEPREQRVSAQPTAADAYARRPGSLGGAAPGAAYQRGVEASARETAPDPYERHMMNALGAGLRQSERARRSADFPEPERGGMRVAILLGIAAALLAVLWVRNKREPVAEDMRRPPAARAEPTAPRPAMPSGALPAAAPAAAQPPAAEPAAAAAAIPSDEAPVPAPDTPAPTAAEPLAIAPERSPPLAAAPPLTHAGAQPPATTDARAAAALKALHSSPAHGSSGAKPSAQGHEAPPAPHGDVAEPDSFSAAAPPSSVPVLVVEQTEKAQPAPVEEEPELPVRSPEAQAAQLARDASTALLAGEVGHAIELLREATQLDPNQALAWRTMGLAFERNGDTQAALAAYRQYMRLAPHGPQSDMVRERMRTLDQ